MFFLKCELQTPTLNKVKVTFTETNMYDCKERGFQNMRISNFHSYTNIQSRAKVYLRLLNKPYVNEVTLTWQNPPLKCY